MAITKISDILQLRSGPAGDGTQLGDILRLIDDELLAIRATQGNVLVGSLAVIDPASQADGTTVLSADCTIAGAALGDFVEVSADVDLVGMILSGYVRTANKVRAVLQNESGAPVDLGAYTLHFKITPVAAVALAAKVLTKT